MTTLISPGLYGSYHEFRKVAPGARGPPGTDPGYHEVRTMNVTKYHGTGNDFFVLAADVDVPDRAAFARAVCDRESGLAHPDSQRTGADGVLFLDLHPDEQPPRVGMTLVQPDGSTAAMCGNGARCAASWAARRVAAATESDDHAVKEVLVDTPAGTRRAEIGKRVSVAMGEPDFDPDTVPVASDTPLVRESVEGLRVTAVNSGVPHAVAFVEDVDAVDLERIAPDVRYADVFPDGANVTVGAPREAGGYDQRTYERGVEGETEACGTGAVALVAAARRIGDIEAEQTIPVYPPGGRLDVTLSSEGAWLRGAVAREFEVSIDATTVAETAFNQYIQS